MLNLSEQALRHFESIGLSVDAIDIDFAMHDLWDTWLTLRGLVAAGTAESLGITADPNRRALLKPEALWEIDNGLAVTALDISRASAVRSAWYHRLRELFETYDYLVLPTTQVFPFDLTTHWPSHIAGVQMSTYHRWLEVAIGGSLAGLPVLNVPAGFGPSGLPMGLQILGPAHADLAVLQVGHAYEHASGHAKVRSPLLT